MYLIESVSADGYIAEIVRVEFHEEPIPVAPCRHRQWDVVEHRGLAEHVAKEDSCGVGEAPVVRVRDQI